MSTSDDRLVATWLHAGEYFAAHCDPGGACEPPSTITLGAAGSNAQSLTVHRTAGGRTLFVWSESTDGGPHVWARSYRQGQGYGEALQLSPTLECSTGASPADVHTTASGHIFAVWSSCAPPEDTVFHLWARRYDPTADGWSERVQISATPIKARNRAAMASDAYGQVTVAWATFEHTTAGQLAASVYTPGSGWSGEALVEWDDAGVPSYIVLFVDRLRAAHVVWLKSPHTTAGEIRTATRPLHGTWSAPAVLFPGLGLPGFASSPVLVEVAPGHTMLAWALAGGTALVAAHHH